MSEIKIAPDQFAPKPTPAQSDLVPYFDNTQKLMVRASVEEWLAWLTLELDFSRTGHGHTIPDITNLEEILADFNQRLTEKLNKIDVYNGLDAVGAGMALDARQGKVLRDTIAAQVEFLKNMIQNSGGDGSGGTSSGGLQAWSPEGSYISGTDVKIESGSEWLCFTRTILDPLENPNPIQDWLLRLGRWVPLGADALYIYEELAIQNSDLTELRLALPFKADIDPNTGKVKASQLPELQQLFNGNRPIKRVPTAGLNVATTGSVQDFLNAVFFPFVAAVVSMNTITAKEKNRISAISVAGAITPNDETVFNARRVMKGGVLWQNFATNNYALNDSISDTTVYRVEIEVGNNGSPATIFATRTVDFILPWFCGSADTDVITAAMIYAATKNVATVGNSLVASFGAGARFLFFAVPKGSKAFTSWYRSALDQGAIGGTQNLFKSKVEISVSSTGILNAAGQPNNWTADYDLYVSNYKTEASTSTTLS